MTLIELAQPARSFATTATAATFQATVSSEHGACVLALHGEADLWTLPTIAGVLAHIINERDGPLVVDLAHATFIDIGTARAVGRASQLLACRGRTLTVRSGSRMALRVFDFLGLSSLVERDAY